VDATYLQADERQAIEALAARANVAFRGIWLEARIDILSARVAQRQADVSDATVAVLAAQPRQPPGKITWHQIGTGRDLEAVKADALAIAK